MQIFGVIVKHGDENDDDVSLITDILVSEEDTKKIMQILEPYANDGGSIRGTWQDIKDELSR